MAPKKGTKNNPAGKNQWTPKHASSTASALAALVDAEGWRMERLILRERLDDARRALQKSLDEAREALGLSFSQVAALTGYDRAHVAKALRVPGYKGMSDETLMLVADALRDHARSRQRREVAGA
jgi:hypothetical protein